MKCLICDKSEWDVIYSYDMPDKYEKWMGIADVKRSWERCSCGFYQSRRDYPIEDLQKIYTSGYRDRAFRHKSIDEAFQYVINLPLDKSENEQRVKDFTSWIKPDRSVLDVGSGLGVFPKRLKEKGYYVWCVEPNKESRRFITHELKIQCEPEIPDYAKFDVATLIHVLEHIVEPLPFLEKIYNVLTDNGLLYIEIPDASEFDTLRKGHNEFSSDHVYFYGLPSLAEIMERAGFRIIRTFKTYYDERSLTRLTVICRKK